MPHPIFQIDELLRLIIDELVKTSRRSAVSLALTCRSLEEPTLSSLWREQLSLHRLIAVLPNTIWVNYVVVSGQGFPRTVSCNSFLRKLRLIPQRRTGQDCNDTRLGCLDCASTREGPPVLILFYGSRVVHPMGFCFPSWSGYTGTSRKQALLSLSSVSSSLPICGASHSTLAYLFITLPRVGWQRLPNFSRLSRLPLKVWTSGLARRMRTPSKMHYLPSFVDAGHF